MHLSWGLTESTQKTFLVVKQQVISLEIGFKEIINKDAVVDKTFTRWDLNTLRKLKIKYVNNNSINFTFKISVVAL